MKEMTYEDLKTAVAGHAAALRCVTEYQPAGGPGDKIFPATYEGGKYATEDRLIDGETVPCVLIDSVQSQANRMELALLEAVRAGRIELPIVETKFDDPNLLKPLTVTSLEAPHRVADAIFRDSWIEENGKSRIFRDSEKGGILNLAEVRNAAGLFGLCPTALIFGIWDSTGPRGGMGAKIQRAVVSEMVGYHAIQGSKTSSRIDPLQIKGESAGPLFERLDEEKDAPGWTIEEDKAKKSKTGQPVLYNRNKSGKGKPGNPSKANHSNIPPRISIEGGGVTISKALQTTVISLPAIRRLRFPLNGQTDSDPKVDENARTALAALGLLAAVLAREEGADLRSRCQLIPVQAFVWELLGEPGKEPQKFELNTEMAVKLFKEALKHSKAAKLPWEGTISLTPHPDLVKLVKKSQDLEAMSPTEEGE